MMEYSFLLLLLICEASAQTLVITNGPVDVIACIGDTVNIPCGFVNESSSAIPDWRIIRRNNDGIVISDMSVTGQSILTNPNDGLQWVVDPSSGSNHTNSVLVVGPVDESYNQSSYQCYFTVFNIDDNVFVNVTSISIGKLTVYGTPSVVSNTRLNDSDQSECTFANILWDKADSHPVCGTVLYDVIIFPSDEIMNGTNETGLTHIFTGLTPSTTYVVFVIGRNNAGTGSVEFQNLNSVSFNTDDLVNVTSPENVMNLTYFDVSTNAVSVRWNPHSNANCIRNLTYFVTIFKAREDESVLLIQSVDTVNTSYTFDGLINGTNYTIDVRAAIGGTNGTISRINVTTSQVAGDDGDGDSDSTGAIIGGIVGGIVAVVVIIVTIVVIYKFFISPSKVQEGPSRIRMQDTEKTPSPVEPVAEGITYADLDIGKGPAAPGKIFPQDKPTYGQVKPSN